MGFVHDFIIPENKLKYYQIEDLEVLENENRQL